MHTYCCIWVFLKFCFLLNLTKTIPASVGVLGRLCNVLLMSSILTGIFTRRSLNAEILDFEVFDTRDAMNVVAYSTMGSGRTYCQAQFSSSWLG